MLPEQPKQHAAAAVATIHNNKAVSSTNSASIVLRVGGGLLILTCLLASLANPYASHPQAHVKSKTAKVKRDTGTAPVTANSTRWFDPIDLVLPQFPTLQAELDSSEVVVLHFGASWCTSCASVATMMDQVLGPKLKNMSMRNNNNKKSNGRKLLSVIYVSSDNSLSQFQEFIRNRYWSKVPFHSAESGRLKKYFQVCAKKEIDKLQLERKYELPYILVLSGTTHKIVSRRGVQDLKKLGPAVLDHWTQLVRGKKTISK